MSASFLPQVKNIVFLMLENRSLDNLLGWLYQDSAPQHVYPSNRAKEYDGLVAGKYSNPDMSGKPIPVIQLSEDDWEWGRIPWYDPFEALRATPDNDPRVLLDNWNLDDWNGVMNQFFGGKNRIERLPAPSDGPPEMQGFLQDYYDSQMSEWNGHDILWTYTREQAKVINALARQYAVSDRWFCSVPSQTNPNRAYSICGTSLGNESNGDIFASQQYQALTIFNVLKGASKTCGLYWDDEYESGKSYTEYTFPHMSGTFTSHTIDDFCNQAKEGSLPDFSYLEPDWTIFEKWGIGGLFGAPPYKTGTDYHPNGDISSGETFLHRIYQAVRGGPQWKNTLFIVTFDEHGGTYDHVAPKWGAKNPDGIDGIENGFKFNLFGARVPTILISPFVKPSTVFRAPEDSTYDFDHTSFIATILRWAGVDPSSAGLGERVKLAPTFEGVLDDNVVNSETVMTEPCRSAGPAAAMKNQVQPAVSPEALKAVLDGIPVAPLKVILRSNTTLDGVKADAARYRQDPKKFRAIRKIQRG